MPKIAFNTANFVARTTNYRFSLKTWMDQHHKTIAATDAREWNAICADIAGAGYKSIEIWQAHADPSVMTPAKAKIWREVLDNHELIPIAYAGGLNRENAEVCAWLGVPLIAGGGHPKLEGGAPDIAQMRAICEEFGVRYAFENHPQKAAAEILERVAGGDDLLGIAVDTGWLGSSGVEAPSAILEMGRAIFHVHVKDVAQAGAHETVPLGEGIVNLEGCLKALRAIGYAGDYSWEDEPEERDPREIAAQSLAWIEARV